MANAGHVTTLNIAFASIVRAHTADIAHKLCADFMWQTVGWIKQFVPRNDSV